MGCDSIQYMPELTQADFDKIAAVEVEKLRRHLLNPSNLNITAVVEYLIKAGESNHAVLAAVKRHFPKCRTTSGSIKTERAHLRLADPSIPTSTQAHYRLMKARGSDNG